MSELTERRRDTLKQIVDQRGGVSKIAKQLGYSNPSFMSQMIGPNPTREITEKTARKFEEKLGLPKGTLDGALPPPTPVPAQAEPNDTALLVAEVIRMVGRTLESEGVKPSADKFADVVALAYLDTISHGAPRESHVKQLARLLK